ncbi:MAG: hypothetical protein WC821_02830 [archaeon]|jgi:hypothetical protein
MKGQAAFESLFLLLIILTAAIAITSLYLQIHDDTMAMSVAKVETLNQLGLKKELIVIDYIKIEKSIVDTNLIIKLTPLTALDINSIKNKVLASTKYKSINILIK